MDLIPKIRVEVLCDDADAETLVDVIIKSAGSGTIGDGKVWVAPLDMVARVRTRHARAGGSEPFPPVRAHSIPAWPQLAGIFHTCTLWKGPSCPAQSAISKHACSN